MPSWSAYQYLTCTCLLQDIHNIPRPGQKECKAQTKARNQYFVSHLFSFARSELLLWQDLRYAPGHPSKEEQGLRIDEGTWNRLLEGLPTLIGVPKSAGARDFVYTEDAGFVFTDPFELTAWRNGVPDEYETVQLTTRLQ